MPISDLFKQADQEYWQDDAMPAYPGLVLWEHVAFRGAVVGALFGTVGASALAGYRAVKSPVDRATHLKSLLKFSQVGLVGGVLLGTGMVFNMARVKEDMNAEGIADRGYRLANNVRQTTADRMMYGAGFLGAVAVSLAPESFGKLSVRVMGGFGVGCLVGLAAFAVTHRKYP